MDAPSQISGLTVREHEREGIAMPFEFVIDKSHGTQLRFSPSSTAISTHVIRGEAFDISSGGMGLKCRQFIPRMCEGVVRVFEPGAGKSVWSSTTAPSFSKSELMLEHPIKVRRVTLIGREPLYSLGVAFLNAGTALDEQIADLVARIAAAAPHQMKFSSSEGTCRA